MLRFQRAKLPEASSEPTRPPQQRYSQNSSSSWVSPSSTLSRMRWANSRGIGGISRRKRIQPKSSVQERNIASTKSTFSQKNSFIAASTSSASYITPGKTTSKSS